jgi:hypothetical protein
VHENSSKRQTASGLEKLKAEIIKLKARACNFNATASKLLLAKSRNASSPNFELPSAGRRKSQTSNLEQRGEILHHKVTKSTKVHKEE